MRLLRALLGRGAAPPPPPTGVAAPPPRPLPEAPVVAVTPLMARLAEIAAGRHVLVAAEDAAATPPLVAMAALHGAASARALSPERPPAADDLLRDAAAALGAGPAVEALLDRARVAGEDAPPGTLRWRHVAPVWWLR